MRRLVLATILLSVCGTADAAPCAMGFSFNFGSDTSTTMLVPHDGRCWMSLHAGARSTFSAVSISAPARNGTAHAEGAGRIIYRSRRGYRGDDSFSFTVSGSGARGPGKTTVRVAVTVQ